MDDPSAKPQTDIFLTFLADFGPREWSQRLGNGRSMPGGRFSSPGDHSGPISGHFRRLDIVRWALDIVRWALDIVRWALDIIRLALDIIRLALDIVRWALDIVRWASHGPTISTEDIWLLWGHLGTVECDFDPFFTPKMRKMEHRSWSSRSPGNATTGGCAEPRSTRAGGQDYVSS